MRKKWQPTRSHRRWQRSAPHLPRDGLGNDEKSSEPSWTRIAGQTLFSGQPRRSRMPLNQTHNPSVAGSSPARPTTVSPGQGLCAEVDDLARSSGSRKESAGVCVRNPSSAVDSASSSDGNRCA
jgi:hypothetical protein